MDGVASVVRVERWERIPGLRHGFSVRAGGVSEAYTGGGPGEMNLGFTREDEPERVRANRAAILRVVGGDGWRGEQIAVVRQVHSAEVRRVRAGERLTDDEGNALFAADGMITDAPGVMLGVQAADCVPVLVVDARRRLAGAFHAGWRGTAAGIVRAGLAAMERELGARAEDMEVAVGPGIGACCYAVGEELRGSFAADLFAEREGQVYLDLWEANRRQAVEAGVDPERVSVVGECTGCCVVEGRRKYFSHRADKGVTGRGMGLVGWDRDNSRSSRFAEG